MMRQLRIHRIGYNFETRRYFLMSDNKVYSDSGKGRPGWSNSSRLRWSLEFGPASVSL